MMVTGMVLAGCSGQPAATGSSVSSCFQFTAKAIGKRPRTSARLTPAGRAAFEQHVAAL
jgi:hypothetical protein